MLSCTARLAFNWQHW